MLHTIESRGGCDSRPGRSARRYKRKSRAFLARPPVPGPVGEFRPVPAVRGVGGGVGGQGIPRLGRGPVSGRGGDDFRGGGCVRRGAAYRVRLRRAGAQRLKGFGGFVLRLVAAAIS